jgi:alkanesulfonate monooxygenase SsuD/methylene tetrahydromethanopterin reductase-like flavin-dependent oxidoreductase (luciferase family)
MRAVLDLAELAEQEGYHSAWLSEHHFTADGHLPAPFTMLGALSQRTESMTIGTSVLLTPLHDPLRVAEELAVADQLSGGRVVLGLGLGFRPIEHRAFGFEPGQRVARLERAVDVIRTAWSGRQVGGVGLLGGDESVQVRPTPYQADGPPIWIGSQVEPGIRRARRLGDGFIAGPDSLRGLHKALQWLGEEGPIEDFAVMLTVFGFVAGRDARLIAAPYVEGVERTYREYMFAAGRHTTPGALQWAASGSHFLDQANFMVGTPDECATQLRPWCEALQSLPGAAPVEVSVRLTWPGMDAEARESVRLFGREVIPALRQADLSNRGAEGL